MKSGKKDFVCSLLSTIFGGISCIFSVLSCRAVFRPARYNHYHFVKNIAFSPNDYSGTFYFKPSLCLIVFTCLSLAFVVASIVLGIKGIVSFSKQSQNQDDESDKPVATLVLGIVGLYLCLNSICFESGVLIFCIIGKVINVFEFLGFCF